MRNHALMAATVIATLLSAVPCAGAGSNPPITPTTDETGRRIFVNDVPAAKTSSGASVTSAQSYRSRQDRLVYWSGKEGRWKPVPRANVKAAQSAAAEVDQYFQPSNDQNSFSRGGFSQQKIDEMIEQAATRHNVDPNLVRALVKVESNFNPNALSRKGAMGLMQLMPQTARQLNVRNPFNPEENVDAGVRHLKQLLESFGGDVKLSLAAYNAGAGAVNRSAGIPRFAETQNYVRRITNLYGGDMGGSFFGSVSREPVRVQRDARGVLYISNTD